MRHIHYLYFIILTEEELVDYTIKAKEAGLNYHPAHIIFYPKTDNEYTTLRPRPFAKNNGLTRDSIISKKSIGIVVLKKKKNEDVDFKQYKNIAKYLKQTTEDLGISSFEIVTDYKDKSKMINIGLIYNEIKLANTDFIPLNILK